MLGNDATIGAHKTPQDVGRGDAICSTLIDVRLDAIRYAAREINLFEFTRPNFRALPPATAGSHIDLHLPTGLVRQYSLVIPSEQPDRYVLGIKNDAASRGGSRYVFNEMRVGDVVRISPPRNNFALADDDAHSVLIAGGIGITPIWAMVQRLIASNRTWELHFSGRSRPEMAFLHPLQTLEHVRIHVDDEASGAFVDLRSIISQAPANSHFYCCGPAPMLAAFSTATQKILDSRVHVEHFSSAKDHRLVGDFTVTLSRSGKTFYVPLGRSILSVLRDAGIATTSSCEAGICGACETVVLSGVPNHNDTVLTEDERASNRTMMICCSGCTSHTLVLDL